MGTGNKLLSAIGIIYSLVPGVSVATPYSNAVAYLDLYVDDDAPVMMVRTSCDDGNGGYVRNCIEDGFTLNVWLDERRRPSAAQPLKVDIGQGSYNYMYIKMVCDPLNGYTGYTSFVGSGPDVTTMEVNQNPITVKYCTNVDFSDFGIRTFYHYINWHGGGTSRWSNMDIRTQGGVWREHECAAERGKHYWFSSKLKFGAAGTDLGYTASCDVTWFYGSEISFGDGFFAHQGGHAIGATDDGEIHVYGGNINGIGTKGSDSALIRARNGGKIHIHGTGIDLSPVAGASGNANVFLAESGGSIHANANAYAIGFSGTAAQITRINENGGSVIAPYNWGALIDPPPVTSRNGSDTFVETDCSPTVCDDGGSSVHTMIYDASCAANPGGPWMDTVTLACRGE